MTTIVYKKGKYIAADKRGIGGEEGWTDASSKIFRYSTKDYHIYFLNSGLKQMPEKIDALLNQYFSHKFDPIDLFNLQEDLKITQQGHDFACLVVYYHREERKGILRDRAWKLGKQACEEIDFHYAAGGSGSDWVDGIMLIKPDIEPKELFELVASKDLYTSPTFDIINLKQ